MAGTQWQFDGVRLRFLHPHRHFPAMRNESSCVLRIESAHGAALLAGDIGAVVERMLVHDQPDALRSDVVLLAHHGSDKSSDPAFVAATGTGLAVASSGHGNRFGHPHPRVMQRWSAAGAATADTARDGAIRIRIGDGAHIERRRSRHPRLWDAVRRGEPDR
jgi:competence protein ComEC